MLRMIIIDIIVLAFATWAVIMFLHHDERKHEQQSWGQAPGYGCLFSWQFFMSARALTMEEMENVNGGLVLRVYWHPKRTRQNPKKA